MNAQIETAVRKSVRKKVISLYIKDIIKSALVWGLGIPFFYLITKDNKILSANPVGLIGCYVILALLPIVLFRLWRIFLIAAWTGRVIKVNTTTALVENRRRNVGMVNRLGDMMRVPSYVLTVDTAAGKRVNLAMNGHLSGLGMQYLPEGSEVVLAFGAKYPWNAAGLPERPYCIYCGYSGAPNEINCTDCGCRMLPARLSGNESE